VLAVFCLPRDHGVCFSDHATFVAGSFEAFVGDFCPKLFQRPRCCFVRMPFGVVRSPRHLSMHLQRAGISPSTSCADIALQSKEDGANLEWRWPHSRNGWFESASLQWGVGPSVTPVHGYLSRERREW